MYAYIKAFQKSEIRYRVVGASSGNVPNQLSPSQNNQRTSFLMNFHILMSYQISSFPNLMKQASNTRVHNNLSLRGLINFRKIHAVWHIEDNVIWKDSVNGELSLKQAYDSIQKPHPSFSWSDFPEDSNIPSSHFMLV